MFFFVNAICLYLSLIYLYYFQEAVEALIFVDFGVFYACLVMFVFILCSTILF